MLTNFVFLTFFFLSLVDGRSTTPPTTNVSSPTATSMPHVTTFQLMEHHGRRLHGLESRMEILMKNVADILQAVRDISTTVAAIPDISRNVAAIPDIRTNVAAIPDIRTNVQQIPDIRTNVAAIPDISRNLEIIVQRVQQIPDISTNVDAIPDISRNLATVVQRVQQIPDISTNVAAVVQNVREIHAEIPNIDGIDRNVANSVQGISVVKKILTGDVIRFPKPTYGDENMTRYYVEGHVEILHDNEWGTICDDWIEGVNGNNVANVICRMGGYQGGRYDEGKYKDTSAPKATKIWLDTFYCTGKESSVGECRRRQDWGVNDCSHVEDIGIRCYI